MKVLCTTTSGAGHWVPLVPVARALLDAGHDVTFACPDTAAAAIRQRGFAVRPFDEVTGRTDEQQELMARAMADGDQALAERAIAMGFGLLSPRAAVPRLEQTIADVAPDLVVRDPAEFGGMVLAERHGIRTVAAAGGLQSAVAYFCGLVDEHVQRLRRELDVRPRGSVLSDELMLTATPASFDVPGDPTLPVLRYRVPLPSTPLPTGEPPLVYATLGTAVMQEPRGRAVLDAILAALAGLDVRAVVTTGVEVDEADVPALPDHVEVRAFADHRRIIPEARAVVTHGGAGTVQDALLMGRPMIVLPQFADQFHNAQRVAELGLGVSLVGEEQTSERIAAALTRVRAGTYDAAVRRLASEAQAMPGLEEAVPRLEALAACR
ncbi:MAG: glycosyltransferase [Actinobacteria bacterium]|nr:glycosyltransferase [Actinomycetota bacterium]